MPIISQDSLIPSLDVRDDDAMGLKENASGIINRRPIAEMLYWYCDLRFAAILISLFNPCIYFLFQGTGTQGRIYQQAG